MPTDASPLPNESAPSPWKAPEPLTVPARALASVPLLVTAKAAAAMCSKSLRTWRSWDAAGWIPQPVRVGRSVLWRTDELRDWIAAGCPRREEWEARK